MLGRLLRSTAACNLNTMAQNRYHVPYKTVARMNLLPDNELFNSTYVKKICSSPLPGYTSKSLKNLYHGVKLRSGHNLCFSDKKSKRWFKPNTFKRSYHSKLLDKSFNIHVTTKALKTIRKYGGFDNYILLCKPEKMQSLFGEYLRRLMYKKLNNPEFDLNNATVFGVHKSNPDPRPRVKLAQYLGFNKENRHKDLSGINPHFFKEMTKKELKTVDEMLNNPDKIPDILSKDQKYLDSIAKAEDEMKKLLPLSRSIKSKMENMKDKKLLRLYKLQIYDAKKNGQNLSQSFEEHFGEKEENKD